MISSTFIWITLGVAAGVIVGTWLVFMFWRVRSQWQRRTAGEAPLQSTREVIWRDPGSVESLDLAAGPGGRDGTPSPPFLFVEEHQTGSNPCISVRDARSRLWRVKWGDEVHSETFATRFAWAAGYFVETTYFMPGGRVEGIKVLGRARQSFDEEFRFRNARFELDEQGVVKHFDEHSWAWNDNPFVGTCELNGLKIVMMLLSNWDNKDVRDVARGSNTGIFEYQVGPTEPRAARGEGAPPLDKNSGRPEQGRGTQASGEERGRRGPQRGSRVGVPVGPPRLIKEARYLIIDWGATLGTWGSSLLSRGRWNCQAFASQNDQFILGMDGDRVLWGYKGQRTADAIQDISRSDVQWLYTFVGALSDQQIAAGLRASGATETEIAEFTKALRARLEKLKEIAEGR